jgi:uncharacterized protein (DUF302 family)
MEFRGMVMLYSKETVGTVEGTVEKIEQAAAENQFGVLGIYNLKEKMADKGVEFGPECRIVEVCNPKQAKKVLEGNMSISTALPCRISVWQEGDKTKVATIKPTLLLDLFASPELKPVAEQVEQVLIQIIDTACQ